MEPAYDKNNIEEITNNLKENKSIEYAINQIGNNYSLQTVRIYMIQQIDSINEKMKDLDQILHQQIQEK